MALNPELAQHMRRLEQEYGLPAGDLFATAQIESNFNPTAVSPAGARGMFQFMPATWEPYAKKHGLNSMDDPFQQAVAAADHRGFLYKKYNDPAMVSAAYNAGEGNVDKYGGVPPFKETQAYVPKYFQARNQWSQEYGDAAPSANPPTPSQPAEQPAEGSNFTKKILPLLLRFGLPTVTGAVLGAKNPFMGAAAGGLMGLTGGGLGYMNAKEKHDMFNQQQKLKADQLSADLGYKKAKMTSDQYWKGKTYGLNENKYNTSVADMEADNARADADLASKSQYRQAMMEASKNKSAAGDKNPKENLLKLLAKQFNNQPINVNDPKAKELFIANLSAQNEAIGDDGVISNLFGDGKDDAIVNDYISSYNQYVTRGQPQQPQQLDADTAKQFLQQAGGDKNKARELAKQAGYSF